jgi:branched-subunit amino acid ABC-type transport system permease component
LLGFVSFPYEYADAVAILMLSAMGLMIIFGMMGVNMAHDEMMTIGAYTTSFGYYAGIPLVLECVFAATIAAAVCPCRG